MALNVRQRKKLNDFGRTRRGLLWAYAPNTDATAPDPSPSVGRFFLVDASGILREGDPGNYLAIPGPSACIQADLYRDYLVAVGMGFRGAISYNNGMGLYNNALNSSADTYIEPAVKFVTPAAKAHTGAVVVLEGNYVNCKVEFNGGVLNVYANGILQDSRNTLQDFPVTPMFDMGSDAVTKVGGNKYGTAFKNLYAMRSNALAFTGLPAYGSVGVSVNGGAETTVNVDGNGDADFDLGVVQFPCKVTYRVFDGANKTGTLRGQFSASDTFGGDTIGTTRTVLQSYPFTPKSLSSLISWHAPESLGGNSGDPVNSWLDSSGFGRTLGKSGIAAPKIQTAVYNGRAVVRFDGSGQLLFSDAIATALRIKQTGTVALALQWAPGNAASHGLLSMMAGGSQGFNVSVGGGAVEQFLTGDNGGAISYPSGFGAPNTIHILLLEFDALRSRFRAWWSSTARLSTGAVADLDSARLVQWSTSLPAFALGTFYADAGAASPALYAAGDVGEVVTYGKRLRAVDRAALMAYLSARWL
jgi:hypothetical protein